MKEGTLNKLALLVLLALASCKAHKQALVNRTPVPVNSSSAAISPAKPGTTDARLNAIRAKQLNFNTFAAKAKTNLDINGNSNDVTLNLRIQHDRKIWVSVTAILGVEVARALITPDSIWVINRLQGVYFKKPFSYVYQYAGKQINYNALESLLIGNAIPGLLDGNADINVNNANTILSGRLQDMMYQLTLGPDFKVSQTSLSNQAGQSVKVVNSAFIQADNRIMPSQIDIASVAGNKKLNIGLHYSNTEFDKVLEYPFTIPDRFKAVD